MIQKLSIAAILAPPIMIMDEKAVQVFCTYDAGRLCTMMHTQQTFYRLVQSFLLDERSAALRIMGLQQRQGYRPVLTIARDGYRVWNDARCTPAIALPQTV
jgi:hypothetical protein